MILRYLILCFCNAILIFNNSRLRVPQNNTNKSFLLVSALFGFSCFNSTFNAIMFNFLDFLFAAQLYPLHSTSKMIAQINIEVKCYFSVFIKPLFNCPFIIVVLVDNLCP